jgi:hypothetical protein
VGDGGVASVLRLPPETFARYQALRGNAPARSSTGTVQNVVVGPDSKGPQTASAPNAQENPAMSTYSLQGVYFNPKEFDSPADCLTAASSHGLPLDLCQ